MKIIRYRDTETGAIYTRQQLIAEYYALRDNGQTECENFHEYLRNCLDKNGFLEEV